MMPTPQVTPWADTLDVTVNADAAVEVHRGTYRDFTPTSDTYQATLYGPGTLHLVGAPPGTDHYIRLVSLDGQDMSATSDPVQTTALTTGGT